MNATTSRPALAVTADGAGVVSHAGSRLLADLAEVTGLVEGYSQVLAGLRERRSRHDPGRVLVDVAVMLADGGEAISDLAVLRQQAARPIGQRGRAIPPRARSRPKAVLVSCPVDEQSAVRSLGGLVPDGEPVTAS